MVNKAITSALFQLTYYSNLWYNGYIYANIKSWPEYLVGIHDELDSVLAVLLTVHVLESLTDLGQTRHLGFLVDILLPVFFNKERGLKIQKPIIFIVSKNILQPFIHTSVGPFFSYY